MKYQIILESEKQLSDDEFQLEVQKLLAKKENILEDFFYIYAQSLDGIRQGLWDKKEKLKDEWLQGNIGTAEMHEETFKEIQDLFKLD